MGRNRTVPPCSVSHGPAAADRPCTLQTTACKTILANQGARNNALNYITV